MTIDFTRIELPGDRLYSQEPRVQTFTHSDACALSLVSKTQDILKVYEVIDRRLNIDVGELTVKDFWFILHWQRINSYPSFPVRLPWTCRHCGYKNLDHLEGSNLVISDLDYDYTDNLKVEFPCGKELFLRLQKVKDDINARSYIRENNLVATSEEEFEQLLVAGMLENNTDLSFEQRLEIIKKEFTSDDYLFIKSFEAEFDYGVEDYSSFTCEECKEVTKVKYRFDLVKFFPNLLDRSDVRSRILSGKTSESTNSKLVGDGSREDDTYSEVSRKDSERVETEARADESEPQSQEEVVQNLQAQLEQEMSKLNSKNPEEELVDFDEVRHRK